MKKAIVTGANGFLGSALCNALSNKGTKVFAVVRNQDSDISRLEINDNVTIVYCDMANILKLTSLIDDSGFDVFYHFAWSGTSGDLRGDYVVQLSNVRYSSDAVRASLSLRCKKFVFASSIMEYEVYAQLHSSQNLGINTIYSSAKLEANLLCRALANSLGVEYNNGIISNVYGPREHSPRLINSSIRKLLSGKHCSFSEGRQIYDFIFIDDAVNAFIVIGERGVPNKNYYIGSKRPRPLRDFLLEMQRVVAPHNDIGLGEIPFSGVSLNYTEFDIDSLRKDTGYEPQISFSEGIRMTSDWIKGDE